MRTSWLTERNELNGKAELFELPPFINFLSLFRPELAKYKNKSLSNRMALYLWWEQKGWAEYPDVDWLINDESLHFANSLFSETKEDVEQYGSLVIEWLTARQGKNSLIVNETKLINYLMKSDEHLFDLPNIFQVIFNARRDIADYIGADKINEDPSKMLMILDWWSKYGSKEYCRIKFNIREYYNESISVYMGITLAKVMPLYILVIYKLRKDLHAGYDLTTNDGCDGLTHWWNLFGMVEYHSFYYLIKLEQDDIKTTREFGVNIIGFPQGTLGLGEDARLAGQVVEGLGVNGVYINAPLAGPEKTITPDDNLSIEYNPKYTVNLFCLPPTEMMRLGIEGGKYLLDGQEYKIGAWPWELPHWPTSFSRVRNFVDEIWAQSEYVKSCFSKEGDTPIYKMPMAVTIPTPTGNLRKKLGIEKEAFVYYIMFDGNSWLSRKNPIAGVLAFQKAFASKTEFANIQLLIKAMNINVNDPMWVKIVDMASRDKRIKIITERMGRQDLINMMSSCDCYISLHRSEGFGRVIAEAMLLEQPVVTTNFSGNVDFCHEDTAFLVDGELIPLHAGDYIFFEGQYWCDPNIDIAATQMIRVYTERESTKKIASAAQTFIQREYSLSAVSKFYKTRLEEIQGK